MKSRVKIAQLKFILLPKLISSNKAHRICLMYTMCINSSAKITHSLQQTGLDRHTWESATIASKTDSMVIISLLHTPVLVPFNPQLRMLVFLALFLSDDFSKPVDISMLLSFSIHR